MRRLIVVAACSIALASCGSSDADADGDGKISMEEAAAKSEDLVKPEPGQYRATVEMVDLQMPDAPKEVQDAMKAAMNQGPQTNEYCLTKEEADKGFEEMIKESQAQDNCTFEKFDADGGNIDAVMVCETPGQPTARMTMKGVGTSTTSKMDMTMDVTGPDGKAMKMVMKSSQERIGDCAAEG